MDVFANLAKVAIKWLLITSFGRVVMARGIKKIEQ